MDALQFTFRHNSWATRRLIEACRGLTPEQLEATTPGAMGSVLQTLDHIVNADGLRFPTLLTGTPPPWGWQRGEVADLDTLAARAEQVERFWIDYLEAPVDADRQVRVEFGGQSFDVAAGVILAQAVHHANIHREQVCTILTVLGVEPPDLSGWGHGGATGHVVEASRTAG
jgi:uncharacterized damage-inducible protein DinB